MEKIISKILLVPVLFFFMYLSLFTMIVQFVGMFETRENSISILVGAIFLANVLSFFITLLIYKLFQKFSNVVTFRRWYHYSHLLYIYISAVITVIISIEPILLNKGVILTPIDDNNKILMVLFVVIVANYSFFNSFVFNRDFKREI